MGVVVIRPWSILVDGDVALRCTELTPVAHAVADAERASRRRPRSAVALVRLGDAGSLRRFEAGREVTP